jgi:hypothetical protein
LQSPYPIIPSLPFSLSITTTQVQSELVAEAQATGDLLSRAEQLLESSMNAMEQMAAASNNNSYNNVGAMESVANAALVAEADAAASKAALLELEVMRLQVWEGACVRVCGHGCGQPFMYPVFTLIDVSPIVFFGGLEVMRLQVWRGDINVHLGKRCHHPSPNHALTLPTHTPPLQRELGTTQEQLTLALAQARLPEPSQQPLQQVSRAEESAEVVVLRQQLEDASSNVAAAKRYMAALRQKVRTWPRIAM